ncbi:hypothetical protein TNCV_2336681 [Trichonephila clavipes]|nr:hypothetical protein TNCV_2336681 [Trichonephila clavipes]
MIRPLSNSLNCEKCLLARLPGMFRLSKSSYNRRLVQQSSTKNGFYGNQLQGEAGKVIGRIGRQNSRFRTAKTTIIKFGLHISFVELESSKNALKETYSPEICTIPHRLFRKSEAVRCDLHVISDAPSIAKHKQLVDTLLFRAQIESEDNPRVTRLPTPRILPAICLNGRSVILSVLVVKKTVQASKGLAVRQVLVRNKLGDVVSHKKKLPVRLINEHYSRTRGHESTPLRVQGDIEDISAELDNEG